MAERTFAWPDPELPDATDADDYTLGVRWTMSGDYPIVGVMWRVPLTVPVGTCAAALWSDDGVLLASEDFSLTPDEGGTDKRIYFDEPYPGVAATAYRASIYTPDRYVATTGYPWPQTDGPLTATVDNGYLTGSAAFPAGLSGNAANFHVSPIVEAPDEPASGSADLPLSLALTATGRRDSRASADMGLSLTLSAAGTRPSRGTAALVLVLALTASGHGDASRSGDPRLVTSTTVGRITTSTDRGRL